MCSQGRYGPTQIKQIKAGKNKAGVLVEVWNHGPRGPAQTEQIEAGVAVRAVGQEAQVGLHGRSCWRHSRCWARWCTLCMLHALRARGVARSGGGAI